MADVITGRLPLTLDWCESLRGDGQVTDAHLGMVIEICTVHQRCRLTIRAPMPCSCVLERTHSPSLAEKRPIRRRMA